MYLKNIVLTLLLFTLSLVQPIFAQDSAALEAALAAQDDEHKSRYVFRNPKETLEFFGIEPGMAVGEVLPGGGWYTKILLPYLGDEGRLIGIDYPIELFSEFGPNSFATPEFIKKKESWPETWTAKAQEWRNGSSVEISAATFSTMPEDLDGSLDAVLFFRALHNMSRFNSSGGYLSDAFKASFKALKPGGIVGVVQHHAREDRSDEWADGNNGYLKSSFIKEQMANVGFQFVSESDINSNDLDQAKEGDNVWRLLPRLGVEGSEEEIAAVRAIGESNRMTLKFIKPAE